jgi:Big-like domain-containing protein
MWVHRAQPRGLRAARRAALAIAAAALGVVGVASATVAPQAVSTVDPLDLTVPALGLSVVGGANPDNQHYDAPTGTLYYNPASGGDFTIEATSDDSADIVSVVFPGLSVDGFAGAASTDSSRPFVSDAYSFTSANVSAPQPVSVIARDGAGSSLFAELSFSRDVDPPGALLSAPVEGATVSGAVTLTAEASDASGAGVGSVAFQARPAASGAYATVETDTSAPYDVSWNTTAVPDGPTVLRLLVTDRVGNTAASAAITVNVDNLDKTNAWKKVTVGPGLAEASSRQVIRTPDGRVYVVAADDTAQKAGSGPGVIRAYRADETGIPISFSEADEAHRPTGLEPDGVLGGPDVRLDSNGIAHVLYVDKANGALVYQTFSTLTDAWGPGTTIATGVDVGAHPFRRGETASALALDANDAVHVVYTSFGSVFYTRNVLSTWTAPEAIASGTDPIHPQLVAEANGDLHVVWLEQGPRPLVRWAKLSGGAWGTPETVAADVLGNTNLDQGPSIILDSAGEPRVLFLSCCAPSTTYVRVMARTAFGWVPDTMPYDLFAHTPQIYGRGDDVYVFLGHDDQIRFGYAYHLSGQPWSDYTPLTSLADGELDGSASVRWDPLHEMNPNIIDVAFFDEDKNGDHTWLPELYYMAVTPNGAGGSIDSGRSRPGEGG